MKKILLAVIFGTLITGLPHKSIASLASANCERLGHTWYPTAQTCSFAPCVLNNTTKCRYGLCVDTHKGTNSASGDYSQGTELDLENRKNCCKSHLGQNKWDGTNSKCLGVDQ